MVKATDAACVRNDSGHAGTRAATVDIGPLSRDRLSASLGGLDSEEADLATRVLETLRSRIGEQAFDRYFRDQTRLTLREGTLEIGAGSGFLTQVLSRRFGEQVRACLADVLDGAEARVEFVVDRSIHHPGGTGLPTPRVNRPESTPPPRRRDVHLGSLDNFVVGRSNELAYRAVCSMAGTDGPAALFLHGHCGMGKTHLLRGLAERYAAENPAARVRYTTGEEFTNEFIAAVRGDRIAAFRKQVRKLDLLCLDDVHFLSNKEATQTELLHTLDALNASGARLALASDEHPREISRLSERLANRFAACPAFHLAAPDEALRLKLVRHIAEKRGLAIEEAAIRLIAEHSGRQLGSLSGFGGSVRELEGLLLQVDAVSRLLPEHARREGAIGALLVRKALGLSASSEQGDAGSASMTGPRPRRPVPMEQIISETCRVLAVELKDLMGRGRHKRVVLARSLIVYLARRLTTLSFPEIARALGRPNHSTVITAEKRLAKQFASESRGGRLQDFVPGMPDGATAPQDTSVLDFAVGLHRRLASGG